MYLAHRREVDDSSQGWETGANEDLVLPPIGSFIFFITRSLCARAPDNFRRASQVRGKPLDISSVVHAGRVTLHFVQLADLSNYVFTLLVSEPEVVAPPSPTKARGTGSGSGAESKSKVDEYLSTLEFPSPSS